MLAERMSTILPPLTDEQAVSVTSIHSLSGTLNPTQGLITQPPFEAPHHTATPAAIIGGGSGTPRPGAASRAHHGVLFLDEARRNIITPWLRGPRVCDRKGVASN